MGLHARYTGRVGSLQSPLHCQNCQAGTAHNAPPMSNLWRSQEVGHKVKSKDMKGPRSPPKLLQRVKQGLGQGRNSKPQKRGVRPDQRDETGAGTRAGVTAQPSERLGKEEAGVLKRRGGCPCKADHETQTMVAYPGTHHRSQVPACGSGCGSCSHSLESNVGQGVLGQVWVGADQMSNRGHTCK